MSSIESKVNLQDSRIKLMNNHLKYFEENSQGLSKIEVKTRLEVLEATWTKFEKDHDRICESKPEQLKDCSYITDDHYSTGQEAYLLCKSEMLNFLDSFSKQNSNENETKSNPNPILPKIPLSQFSGDYQTWTPFSDIFSSLVGSNPDLSDVVKMHYLKGCLVGEAAQLISNLQISGENFSIAWNKLVARYENKRVLINTHLDAMFKIKPLVTKSAKGLNSLLSTINESLSSLKALGSPTNHWDHIITYMIINRLDAETHESWEVQQGAAVNPPTLSEVQQFIEGRARALESIESRESSILVKYQNSLKPISNTRPISKTIQNVKHFDNFKPNASFCPLCNSEHYLSSCKVFSQKSPNSRRDFLLSKHLCFNCLGPHTLKDCRSQKSCLKCNQRHHTMIHDAMAQHQSITRPQIQSYQVDLQSSEHKDYSSHSISNLCNESSHTHQVVLLATAQVIVTDINGNSMAARALIDQGSEISFINERIVQSLNLKRSSSSVPLVGIGGATTSKTRGLVHVKLSPVFDTTVTCPVSLHILPKLTSNLPSAKISTTSWHHVQGLNLADPTYMIPGSIDIIIGADVYGLIILPSLRKGPPKTPIAQLTIFGWVLSGPSGSAKPRSSISINHCSQDDNVDKLLQKFWLQEEIPTPKVSSLSPESKTCEEHFKSTHSRNKSGRYIVKLPLKEPPEVLGDSRSSALIMLNSLQKRFSTKPEFSNLYKNFIKEYENLNHMSKVNHDSQESNPTFYLPHHGVIRENSSTTKLRVVFNGSQRTTSGKSLNNILYTGEKLQTDIANVLTWFRRFKYVFQTDIEKMYRQILVHPDDCDLQRILWIEDKEVKTFQLKTVTYGLSCAPFLALRTMNQLIYDHGEQYPLGAETLKSGRYVDDIFGGADTLEQCQEVVNQTDQLCKKGCFPLQKWISNDPHILQSISPNLYAKEASLSISESLAVHTLGLLWKPLSDTFQFLPETKSNSVVTKRNVLSRVAQFFDPLGFLAPITIQSKVFLQQLWLIKLDWDSVLPNHLQKQWSKFENQLKHLSNLKIPRYLGLCKDSIVEIHGFSDASQLAMSAVIYIRIQNFSSVHTSFICAKTKVAPLKKVTIPRLELSAATLLVRLVKHVRGMLNLTETTTWLWTDSSIALTWITSHHSKWKEFVSNRVCFIQEQEPTARWSFIAGLENPADCATRGMNPNALINNQLWWHGPSWLVEDSGQWPNISFTTKEDIQAERRLKKSALVVHIKSQGDPELLQRFSSLSKLLRVTSWIKRFINKLRKVKEEIQPFLTPKELNDSLLQLIKVIQYEFFQFEVKLLTNNQPVGNTSHLRNFNPFLDKDGLIRLGGRLDLAPLEYDAKHPFILPKNSYLSKLIIWDSHIKTLHSGTQSTLSTVRQRFWIIGGRPTVKKEILRCVTCARYRAERAQQLMGQLPPSRVTPSRPFFNTGVDYAGPFVIKTWRGRAAKTYKAYVVIFICSSTSAVHLELVTDYSSDAFIAAFKRFTSRRGICSTIRSDCGTTFVGANTELNRLFSSCTSECSKIRELLSNDGTHWIFNPPSAPHFGGHWEAGVKSVKFHLKRVVGDTLLTYEEFSTILTQIEGVLNSRPLCQLTDDPDDLAVLTPAHFLIGGPISSVPEPDLSQINTSRLSRWQLTRKMLDNFWNKWSREYLHQQQAIYKWRFPSTAIEVGSIVLIVNELYPPSKWPLGKVIQVHPGPDNLTRVVTLKTSTGTLKRPITKLCPLPIDIS